MFTLCYIINYKYHFGGGSMPNWNEVLREINAQQYEQQHNANALDIVRRKYLKINFGSNRTQYDSLLFWFLAEATVLNKRPLMMMMTKTDL